MSERHERGTFEQGVKKEQREGASEYALCLYSDFAMPELGDSKPLGRILDEEIYFAFEYDPDDKSPGRRPTYWMGNNETLGWREIEKPDHALIWDTFKEIARDKLFTAANAQNGASYWYQKFVVGRQPGSPEWLRNSGNPPEVKRD
jgi:hypothetical protein